MQNATWLAAPWVIYLSRLMIALSIGVLVWQYRQRLGSMFVRVSSRDSLSVIDISVFARKASFIAPSCSFALILFGFNYWAALIIGVLIYLFLPRIMAWRAQEQYYADFDNALPDSLMGLSSSLKAGLTIQKALEVAVHSTAPVFSEAMNHCLKEYMLGVPIDDALEGVRARVKTPSVNMAFGALIIGRQLGGPLPDILSRISATVRERLRVEGRLQVLTAQGRAQGIILCGSPLLIGLGTAFFDPAKFALLTDTLPGQMLLGIAILLWLLGVYLTWKVMQLEV